MNKCLALLLSLGSLGTTVRAQEQAPNLLLEAAHCLAAKNSLPPLKSSTLNVGYLVDTKSYPGQKVVYVVVYAGPRRSDGWVFSVFLNQENGRRIFNVANNATFVRSNKEGIAFRKEGVDFVEPPLWGIWTQEHIAMAIDRIEQQPRFVLRAKDLMIAHAHTRCEAYTDNK